MSVRPLHFFVLLTLASPGVQLRAQSAPVRHHANQSAAEGPLDPGSISDGAYRNKSLGLIWEIPEEWVLRTDQMNAEQQQEIGSATGPASSSKPDAHASSAGAKVLLAAFSRPPEAAGQEVNSSMLIAAEPVSAYPGLQDPEQYFGPLSEVAEAQGFTKDAGPYEIAIGPQALVRADFHKDVGTRVMRQSTLVMLSHGYAISITAIAGTEEGVEQLLNGLDFQRPAKGAK